MSNRLVLGVLCVVGAGLTPAAANAQWSDNFDGYPTGSINGLGGWQGWDNVAGAAGIVSSSVARSGPNSQAIAGPADSVRRYSGVTAGQWRYTAWQFIPDNFAGTTYFILNNQYNDGGPYSWAVQIIFNSANGLVLDDNGRAEANQISFVRGAWAEVRVDFDLDANTLSQYYNGTLLASGAWAGGTSPRALGGVDLYANNASVVYYDDIALIPAPASLALLSLGGLVAGRRRR